MEESGGATIAEVRGRNGSLELTARPGPGGYLKAPKNGVMDGLIEESLRSVVSVRLADGYGNTIFEDQCSSAGMERYTFESLGQAGGEALTCRRRVGDNGPHGFGCRPGSLLFHQRQR